MANLDLTKYGITGTTEIVHNPSYELLFEEETKPELVGYEKGQVSELGAVNVMTGVYTGRSPKDKYIVMDENSKDTVWWTSDEYKNDNHPMSESTWATVKDIAKKELCNKRLFVVDAFCGANKDTRMAIRFIVEVAWQAHFVTNMFIKPTAEELENFEPDFVVGGGGAGYGGGFGGGGFGGFGDIFDTIFGGGGFGGFGGNPTGPEQGEDIRVDVSLTLEEAFTGVTREITVGRSENCPTCHGSGAKPGTSPKTCTVCGGTGQVRRAQQTALGRFMTTSVCTACGGTGEIIDSPCADCRGRGTVRRQRKIKVKIPAGIDNGQYVTLSREGSAGKRGGPNGDVYVVASVKPHRLFKRNGADLSMEMPISFVQAALGDELRVPTLTEDAKYRMPEGTQPGTVVRLKGKGMPRIRGGQGDLFVTLKVEVPKNLTERQKELLREFDGHSTKEGKKGKGLFDKIFNQE